jgi:hypothetical protein
MLAGLEDVDAGSLVDLAVRADEVHLFHPETGLRLG